MCCFHGSFMVRNTANLGLQISQALLLFLVTYTLNYNVLERMEILALIFLKNWQCFYRLYHFVNRVKRWQTSHILYKSCDFRSFLNSRSLHGCEVVLQCTCLQKLTRDEWCVLFCHVFHSYLDSFLDQRLWDSSDDSKLSWFAAVLTANLTCLLSHHWSLNRMLCQYFPNSVEWHCL